MIDRSSVGSSNILEVGYDPNSETLEVMFNSGAIYQYYNISQIIYDDLMNSSSKGQFLNTYIKNFYPYSRVG